jgi:hypothetical protein
MLFHSLTNEQKIDFFVKCQTLLIAHHPTSEFLFTETNLKERKEFVYQFFHKYKGFFYQDENVCVLYNKIKVEDEGNPIKALKDHMYRPPVADYNAISIDFVVFRKLEDCFVFCKTHYEAQIAYILFVKNNNIKLYKTAHLLKSLSSAPLVMFESRT